MGQEGRAEVGAVQGRRCSSFRGGGSAVLGVGGSGAARVAWGFFKVNLVCLGSG
jgi:hypothetical protein